MKRSTISLGRILGIPIRLDYSWFLIFGLLTWSLATSYYPAEFRDWPAAQYWIVGAVTVILMFASVLLHELGHSVVALHYKVPIRSIKLFIFGGVAQMGTEPPRALAEFWIAIAGPITSFALALFFSLLQPVVGAFAPLLALAKYLTYINGTLGLFNLIPGFPLDGGRVFRAILWGTTHSLRRATLTAAGLGRFIAYGFILLGVWQIFNGNLGDGLWIALIGWFLENTASSQIRQQTIRDLLEGHRVTEAMRCDNATIFSSTPWKQLVSDHVPGNSQRRSVVQPDDLVSGLPTLHMINPIPAPDSVETTTIQMMTPVSEMEWLSPDDDLTEALEKMNRAGVKQLPVVRGAQILGSLTLDDVISFCLP